MRLTSLQMSGIMLALDTPPIWSGFMADVKFGSGAKVIEESSQKKNIRLKEEMQFE